MKTLVMMTLVTCTALASVGCSKNEPPVVRDTPSGAVVSTAKPAPSVTTPMSAPNAPGTATSKAPDMHVSRTSVDWAGTYTGTPVCANCAKVEYRLELRDGNKFTLNYTDPSTQKAVKYEGDFKWDETGNSIGANLGGHNYVYRVGENRLIRQATDAPADAPLIAPLEYKKVP